MPAIGALRREGLGNGYGDRPAAFQRVDRRDGGRTGRATRCHAVAADDRAVENDVDAAAETDLVWQQPGVGGFLLRDGQRTQLPGNDPAIGGALIAWHTADLVTVAARDTLQPVVQLTVPGVEKLALSNRWLAYRVRLPGGSQQLRALAFEDPASTITVSRPRAAGRLGRPSVWGDLVVFHTETPERSWLSALSDEVPSIVGCGVRSMTRCCASIIALSSAKAFSKTAICCREFSSVA